MHHLDGGSGYVSQCCIRSQRVSGGVGQAGSDAFAAGQRTITHGLGQPLGHGGQLLQGVVESLLAALPGQQKKSVQVCLHS